MRRRKNTLRTNDTLRRTINTQPQRNQGVRNYGPGQEDTRRACTNAAGNTHRVDTSQLTTVRALVLARAKEV